MVQARRHGRVPTQVRPPQLATSAKRECNIFDDLRVGLTNRSRQKRLHLSQKGFGRNIGAKHEREQAGLHGLIQHIGVNQMLEVQP
jgi:hypothetical protein